MHWYGRGLTRDDLRCILGYMLTVSVHHGETQAQPGVSVVAFTKSVTRASFSLGFHLGLTEWAVSN